MCRVESSLLVLRSLTFVQGVYLLLFPLKEKKMRSLTGYSPLEAEPSIASMSAIKFCFYNAPFPDSLHSFSTSLFISSEACYWKDYNSGLVLVGHLPTLISHITPSCRIRSVYNSRPHIQPIPIISSLSLSRLNLGLWTYL